MFVITYNLFLYTLLKLTIFTVAIRIHAHLITNALTFIMNCYFIRYITLLVSIVLVI